MKILYIEEMLDDNLNQEVFDILKECDKEFYPPLSSREKSTQMDLKNPKKASKEILPNKYFENMIKQRFLIAVDDKEVVAFMTFIEDYKSDVYSEKCTGAVNSYITTICVSKDYRKKGLCKVFYDTLEDMQKSNDVKSYISTRTWSKNKSHISILDKRGYERFKVIEDDRGKGIDTIYFLKEIE